jgi:hypothetical protein
MYGWFEFKIQTVVRLQELITTEFFLLESRVNLFSFQSQKALVDHCKWMRNGKMKINPKKIISKSKISK